MNPPGRHSQRLAEQSYRIDYKIFNDTGAKVAKQSHNNQSCQSNQTTGNDLVVESIIAESPVSELSSVEIFKVKTLCREVNKMSEAVSDLKTKISTLLEDIEDHLEENEINESILFVEDVDSYTSKLEQLRTQYRTVTREMKKLIPNEEYESSCQKVYDNTLHKIKDYIVAAKERKNQLRRNQADMQNEDRSMKERKENEEMLQKRSAAEFLLGEVQRMISELCSEFSKTKDDVTDEEIIRRKDNLADNMLKLDRLSNKFQKTLEIIPDRFPDKDKIIKDITTKYRYLIDEKTSYETHLNFEIQQREIVKEMSFQTSFLNIQLQKFMGYTSDLDVYSFQKEFEKLYLKSTPTKMLPDLLKNNYLADPALSLVKSLEDINEIWKRLHKAYGDSKVLLRKKLTDVKKVGQLWKFKDPERLKDGIMALINAITDLIQLSKKHHIEQKLYNGDALDMIYGIMGDARVTRWLSLISEEEDLEDEELWERLIKFLEKDLHVQQAKALLSNKLNPPQNSSSDYKDKNFLKHKPNSYISKQCNNDANLQCSFCNEIGHVQTNGPNGTSIIQYFACKKFVQMNPSQRFRELRSRGLCCQCLYPGAKQNEGKHSTGNCQSYFVCKHSSHDKFSTKKHVLVCQDHCDSTENLKILETYKSRCIVGQKIQLESFSKDIKLSLLAYRSSTTGDVPLKKKCDDDSSIIDNGIYIIQTIEVESKPYTIFFDSGCSDLVSRYEAIQTIGNRASLERKGPIYIGGVGESKTESSHGIYQLRLPLHNGKNAVLSGVCLDKITSTFPQYPLHGQVIDDIHKAYKLSGGDTKNLPAVPRYVGGDVDFMIGVKYLRYHPEKVFSLPSGLTIYESPFVNVDGSRGVVGGPHAVFTAISKQFNNKMCQLTYFTEQCQLYKLGYQVNPDNHLLSCKHDNAEKIFKTDVVVDLKYPNSFEIESESYTTVRKQKLFEEVENAASEILYRCIDCRKCTKCRNGDRIELVSIKEEVEQDVINKSVKVDTELGITTAKLPLMEDPNLKLAPNKEKALAVYRSQLKKLSKCEKDKEDVIASENKLQTLGHVEYVRNLSPAQQQNLKDNPVKNYIPWRYVWNENSISTPCRLVFDASQATSTSYSLNDILAKGRNNMNKLVEIIIRWTSHAFAFHTDVQKMYNSVKLQEEDWCLQRYVWQEELNPQLIPEEKVIKTLIYGVKSSGNQAERALRDTANKFKDDYPEVAQIVQKDIYVDDCISGENSMETVFQRADELAVVLKRGGFGLKGFTFSGRLPLDSLSHNGEFVNIAGIKWFPEKDEVQLDIKELNFSKKIRGKKLKSVCKDELPLILTRRHCVGKVSEIFDITGRVTPLIAQMKLDLHVLVNRKLDWDDAIPDELRPIWISHFEMIKEISQIKFKRAIIPEDAVNLQINTIDTGDASKHIACVAIYARFLRKNQEYSCQLVFARSKLISEGMTQPRCELFAANLNAHTGEVVKRAFGQSHTSAIKLTDSQIALHWINNKELPLKQWVRNRVVDISRFTDPDNWKYVQSENMVADIGTRRVAGIKDVVQGSPWNCGFDWMKCHSSMFPVKTYEEIKASINVTDEARKEIISKENITKLPLQCLFATKKKSKVPDEVTARYKFSSYLLDPNKYRFKSVVRIMAMVQRFIKNCCHKRIDANGSSHVSNDVYSKDTCSKNMFFTDEELQCAANYFYQKASHEVKKFIQKSVYEKISTDKDGILYYTGRILPTQTINSVLSMTDTMIDLTSSSFVVPIVDRYSPIAYSVVNEIHWYNKTAKHSGVETVLRYTMQHCYIIEGRELVKSIKKSCERCRYLQKRTVEIEMGPVSQHSLTIAPAFYISQVDLAGPFLSYSPQQKRTTVKIWFAVFCCAVTSTVSIKVMENYSTAAFIQAFIRLSCEVGYPKVLLIDEGSQIVKGCQSMVFSFEDFRSRLHIDMNVQFEICPVGGHNMHGKVERKIRQVRESMNKALHNDRLSILQWETLAAEVANSINNLPIAIKNKIADLDNLDLLTPNRLRLGRNNDRSPCGPLFVTGKPDKIITANKEIFDKWFEQWLISYVPNLMQKPKWFKSDSNLSIGDVVLFLKKEGDLNIQYQYGMIKSIETSQDGKVRKANVRYRNHNENVDRITRRAVRELVIIHSVDELDMIQELGEVATVADIQRRIQQENNH